MNPTLLFFICFILGAIVGIGLWTGISYIRILKQKQLTKTRPEIPSPVIDILDNLDKPAFLIDIALKTAHVNKAAQKDNTQIKNFPLNDTEFLNSLRNVLDTGEPFIINSETNKDIKITAFRVTQYFVVVLVEDTGAEKRLNTMRHDFIANVSHEFKTPIAAISLLAEAINQAADDTELVENFSAKLVKEAKRLGDLSRDIIHLSRAQSDVTPKKLAKLNLAKILEATISQHKNLADTKNVKLQLPTELPKIPNILGDAEALDIAISNLISNAIRFSPKGGKVGIGIIYKDNEIKVSVTDHGPGIPKPDQERVFERFYRVDTSRNRSSGGTGLGLSIAKHTAISHGGRIDLWSETGKGSTFTMVIPAKVDSVLTRKAAEKKAKKRLRKTEKQVSEGLGHDI